MRRESLSAAALVTQAQLKTLCAPQVLKRGFWCDVVNGPYHSFGTWTEPPDDVRLLQLRNKEHVFTAVDVAVHNVTVRHQLRASASADRVLAGVH